jgi:hypothetical protein
MMKTKTSGRLNRVKLLTLATVLLPTGLLAMGICLKTVSLGCGSKLLEGCCLICGGPVSCNVSSTLTYSDVDAIGYPPGGSGRERFESLPDFTCKWACTTYCYEHVSPWPRYLSDSMTMYQFRIDPTSPTCKVGPGY